MLLLFQQPLLKPQTVLWDFSTWEKREEYNIPIFMWKIISYTETWVLNEWRDTYKEKLAVKILKKKKKEQQKMSVTFKKETRESTQLGIAD